jgi:glucan 1,3-beta-glucosidase
MTCSGAPQETCGGPNHLDLYSYASMTAAPTTMQTSTSTSSGPTATASGWNFRGCYIDNVSGRALPNGEQVPGGASAMTNELCQSTCLADGFSIAGTEYAGECCK